MKFYCENCDDDVKVNDEGECPLCHEFLDIDEDLLVSGVNPDDDNSDRLLDEGDGYFGTDIEYDYSVQDYE